MCKCRCAEFFNVYIQYVLTVFSFCSSLCYNYLSQLFDHLLNADVSILRDFALHLCEPFT